MLNFVGTHLISAKRLVKISVFYIIRRNSLGFGAFASTAEASSANESFKRWRFKVKVSNRKPFSRTGTLKFAFWRKG